MRLFSEKQGPIVGAGLATLIAWYYAGAVEGDWTPAPTPESGAALAAVLVAVIITWFTERTAAKPEEPAAAPPPSTGAPP